MIMVKMKQTRSAMQSNGPKSQVDLGLSYYFMSILICAIPSIGTCKARNGALRWHGVCKNGKYFDRGELQICESVKRRSEL
jgi:hypothetical protein